MRFIYLVLVLALTAPAAAQQMPKTVKLYDNKSGAVLGTATISGNKIYLRDLKDEFVGTVVLNGTKKTFYDPSGNVVDGLSIAGGPVKLPDEP